MSRPITSAALRGYASDLRSAASTIEGRIGYYTGDIAAAKTCIVELTSGCWKGPRARNDVDRFKHYVDAIDGMDTALTKVAAKLTGLAGEADELANVVGRHEVTLATRGALLESGRPDEYEVAAARSAIGSLAVDWLVACSSFATALNAECEALEVAYAAQPSGFWPAVVTGRPFVGALATLAGALRLDLEDLGVADPEARSHFEAGFDEEGHTLVVVVMSSLSESDAAAYWNTLTDTERRDLIRTRRDLVAAAISGGAVLGEAELQRLDGANRFPQFSDMFLTEVEASVGIRLVTVELSEEWQVTALTMSDGTVQVAVGRTVQAGGGIDVDGAGFDVEASAGAFATATHVFVFSDVPTAEQAIRDLHGAATAGIPRNFLVDAGIFGLSVLTRSDMSALSVVLTESKLDGLIDDLWAEHGYERQRGDGVYASVAAELEATFLEVEGEAEVTVASYGTEPADGQVDETLPAPASRSGVIITGVLGADVDGALATGSVRGMFSVDVFEQDGSQYVTVTVEGALGAGVVGDWVGSLSGPFDLDMSAEAGLVGAVEVRVPVGADDATAFARDVVTELLSGNAPTAVFEPLYESAEIRVSVDAMYADFEADAELDAGVVEVEVEHTRRMSTNLVTLHKYPGGDVYSQSELNELIDEQPGADAIESAGTATGVSTALAGLDPDAYVYDEHGAVIGAITPDAVVWAGGDSAPYEIPAPHSEPALPIFGGDEPEPPPNTIPEGGAGTMYVRDSPPPSGASIRPESPAPVLYGRDGEPMAFTVDGGAYEPLTEGDRVVFDEHGQPSAVVRPDEVAELPRDTTGAGYFLDELLASGPVPDAAAPAWNPDAADATEMLAADVGADRIVYDVNGRPVAVTTLGSTGSMAPFDPAYTAVYDEDGSAVGIRNAEEMIWFSDRCAFVGDLP